MLLRGVLREQILPKELRSTFRKSVAMVDEPDISFRHFESLASQLNASAQASQVARLRAVRQLYVCLWIMYVWARDTDNVEAPYKASELSLLFAWSIYRPLANKKNKNAKQLRTVLSRLILLHIAIASSFLGDKILPHAGKKYAISMAVRSRQAADVNLKLFDILGRVALTGLWQIWLGGTDDHEGRQAALRLAYRLFESGCQLIKNNPCLMLPLCDDQAIDVALFLLLAAKFQPDHQFAGGWLAEMARRLRRAVISHGRYPTSSTSYREILVHPRAQTLEYRNRALAGSTLVPLLAGWLAALGNGKEYQGLVDLTQRELNQCTLQLWLPDQTSDELMYCNHEKHGPVIAQPSPL